MSGRHRLKERAVIGDWNAICDRCGEKYKASELRLQEHTGLRLCPDDWETRHIIDFYVQPKESTNPPFTNSPGTDQFGTGNSTAEGFDGEEVFDDTSGQDPITTPTLQAGDADGAVVTKAT